MIKAVIFDMDGVIFDTEALCLKCWKEVGEKHQIPFIDSVALECIGTTTAKTEEILREHYGSDFDYETYRQELSERFLNHINEEGMPMKPGIYDLLAYLEEHGVKIGLASSTQKERVEAELDMAGILKYFDVVVGGDMVKKSKPEPDIFLECAKQLGVNPEDTYVIEDSYNGIRSASRATMHPIMVPDLLEPTEEMQQLATEILHDLQEVKQYFEIMQ